MNAVAKPSSSTEVAKPDAARVDTSRYSGAEKAAIILMCLGEEAKKLWGQLDEEEIINQAADIPYTVYPCPVPTSAYPARALVLPLVDQRMLTCRARANAAQTSFAARRTLVQQCLRG